MALSVQGLAVALQTLLIDGAEQAAKDAGFVVRRRKITAAGFVQALVLGWLDDPDATLDDLAAPLGVAPQSLQGRFDARAVDCLRRVFKGMTDGLFAARPETIPLLRRFTEVCIEDASSIALPDRCGSAIRRAIDRPCRAEWYAITSASRTSRAALSVVSSGSPGPRPTP